jgi:hypothetical protein
LEPHHFKKDAEQVLNFLKLRIGVKGKIGVYGRSLGCTAVSHLQDKVDMAIADRGFSDLWTLAEKKFHTRFASSLMKYGTFGWQIQNGFNFLQMSKSYKVIMQDPCDEIIPI